MTALDQYMAFHNWLRAKRRENLHDYEQAPHTCRDLANVEEAKTALRQIGATITAEMRETAQKIRELGGLTEGRC